MQAEMEFNEARQVMLNFYFYTEKQYKEFIDIIPLTNSPITYSPIMYNVLQSSCGQIENMLRLLCDKLNVTYEQEKFPYYYRSLNVEGVLERQQIALLKESGGITPFRIEPNQYAPFWWRGYNETKHKLPEGIQQGNLGNVTNALGALFTLHCIAYYCQFSDSTNILKASNWHETTSLAFDSNMEVHRESFDPRPKSEIFYCLSYFNEHGAPTL